MDEDIKNEILAALQALREGAPEAWQHLCAEAAQRGIFMAGLGLGVMLVAIIFGLISRRLLCQGNEGGSVGTAIVGCVALVVSVVFIAVGGYDMSAPALTLLGR